MKPVNSKFVSGEFIIIIILALLSFSPATYSQSYTKEVIELWENGSIPFNKEGITLSETIDSTGRRISQISNPVLYVYRKTEIQGTGGPALLYCPGGGYAIVSINTDHGENYAKRFFEMGFNVVEILKYVQLKKGGHGFGFNFAKTGVDWTVGLEEWLRKETKLFDNQ